MVESGWEDAVGGAPFPKDVKDRAEIDTLLDSAREQVESLAGEMRGGAVRPCPDTCSFRGTCTYPSICRTER